MLTLTARLVSAHADWMRLILVGVLVAVVGCGSGAEPGDYGGTGGADAGAVAGSGGSADGGALGAGGSVSDSGTDMQAIASCNLLLNMITGQVSASSGSAPQAYSSGLSPGGILSCQMDAQASAAGIKTVTDGQIGASWTEENYTILPNGTGQCTVEITYTASAMGAGGCGAFEVFVQLAVPPQ
jgi:hypothetical protein